MDAFLKIYLPLFMAMFMILVFIVPSTRVYRQTGINPFRFKNNYDDVHDYAGALMKLFIVLLFLTVIVYSLLPAVYNNLYVFEQLDTPGFKITGLLVTHISLAGILVAQYQMKSSWRIGIDFENKTRLVTSGLFSVSRNPVFLLLLLAVTGLFLLLPNIVLFALLPAVYIVLQVTMRLEEDFLHRQHGSAYELYKQKVRRLI